MKNFIRRITVRHVIWFLFSILTLIAVLFAMGNWTGARRWAKTQALLNDAGETLEFKALLPPTIEESRNFCAIEPLRDITLPGDEKSLPGTKRKVLDGLAKSKEKSPVMTTGGPALAVKMDLHGWVKFARESKLIESSTDSPLDVLAGFDRAYPVVKQLADAAVSRPEAAFVPTLKERILPDLLYSLAVPHYSGALQAARALRLRAVIAQEAGDMAAAVGSAQAIFRLSEAAAKEPLLIGFLVSLAIHEQGEEALWGLLEKRGVGDADLAALQASLQQLDLFKAELSAMRGELASGIGAIEMIQNGSEEMQPLLANAGDIGSKPPFYATLQHLIPSGFYDHNKATLVQLYQNHFIQPLKAGGAAVLRMKSAQVPEELVAHRGPLHPSYVFASVTMPALSRVIDKSYSAEAIRRQAMVACALERYFLQHKSYPAALKELVPAFVEGVPNDPMDNKMMRYQRTEAGRYVLWSIALDERDDGGRVKVKPDRKAALGDLYRTGYEGDWAWGYEALK